VIAPPGTGQSIRENYGFFPKIITLQEIENLLIPERDPSNPYKTWLKYKSIKYVRRKVSLIPQFAKFFITLLDEIKDNLDRLTRYQNPENRTVLEEFQKYVSQASVEPYAIKRRHDFLEKAFEYYRSAEGKGKIIRKA
jgi:hypothetical protein